MTDADMSPPVAPAPTSGRGTAGASWRPARVDVTLAVAVALALVAVVQVLTLRGSWFFLDDLPALAEARTEGLTPEYLGRSVARHFLPGHKLFDWIAAVPFGPSWTVATALLTVSSSEGVPISSPRSRVCTARRGVSRCPALWPGPRG